MTVQLSLAIFVFCSTATSLTTEAIKKTIGKNKKIADNLLVLFVALFVGCGVTTGFYLLENIPFDASSIIYIPLMGVANWIGAMVGYDKVIQLIDQIGA